MPLHRTAAGSRGCVYVEWQLQADLWILGGPRSQAPTVLSLLVCSSKLL